MEARRKTSSRTLLQNQPFLHASLKDKTQRETEPSEILSFSEGFVSRSRLFFLFLSSIFFYSRSLLSVYLFTLLTHERLVLLREFED